MAGVRDRKALEDDERYMRMALELGRRGVGRTSPNPPVGAVVVRRGEVVGRGFHRRAGAPHGEAAALADAGTKARGAVLYVTLEPCAHRGRRPPCVDAVIAAGVREVVVGTRDPNPHVRGGGVELLRRAGIRVRTGVLRPQADDLIAAFRKHVTTGMPFVSLKLAASLDGRIATATGASRWITGVESRRLVHRMRNEHDAILVGAETVIRDDPELTCRQRGGRNPLRVILDGRLRIPATSRLVRDRKAPTLVVTTPAAPAARRRRIESHGAEVMVLPGRAGRIPLRRVLAELGRRSVMSVLIEGGSDVASSVLAGGVGDRIYAFLAPILIGADGRAMIGTLGVRRLDQAVRVAAPSIERVGDDVLLICRPAPVPR